MNLMLGNLQKVNSRGNMKDIIFVTYSTLFSKSCHLTIFFYAQGNKISLINQ